MLTWLKKIPKAITQKLKYYGGLAGLIVFSLVEYIGDKKGKKSINKVMMMQIYFTGTFAVNTVSLVGFALGAVAIMQLFTQLGQIGALDMVGQILSIVVVRELGPIITSFIVIARSGSAIAADIGTMMVNDEINAMEMLGINTLTFIVFPRIVGVVVANLFLTIYFCAIGLIGGFLVSNIYAGVTFEMFSNYVMKSITIVDVSSALLKSLFFGMFMAAISIYQGFQAFVPTQIPQVTTKAVVNSIGMMFFLEVIITLIFYL